jgi:small redox-active disulfide protein 2
VIIKVLGPGCTNCKNLERVTRQAIDDLGIDATLTEVDDYPTIVGYGVMATPALVVDEKVVLSGRVPSIGEVRDLLAVASGATAGQIRLREVNSLAEHVPSTTLR